MKSIICALLISILVFFITSCSNNTASKKHMIYAEPEKAESLDEFREGKKVYPPHGCKELRERGGEC